MYIQNKKTYFIGLIKYISCLHTNLVVKIPTQMMNLIKKTVIFFFNDTLRFDITDINAYEKNHYKYTKQLCSRLMNENLFSDCNKTFSIMANLVKSVIDQWPQLSYYRSLRKVFTKNIV